MVTARATLSMMTAARPRRVAMSFRPSTSGAHDVERMARAAARERFHARDQDPGSRAIDNRGGPTGSTASNTDTAPLAKMLPGSRSG